MRLSLFHWLALVLGGGPMIGFVTAPGEWYVLLVKPLFNPPSWLFAPVNVGDRIIRNVDNNTLKNNQYPNA